MARRENIHGFVLAGGQSRRMGQDKALMTFAGKPLVMRAAEVLRPYVQHVALLAPAGRYADLGLPVIEDRWPGQGPLAAVCTGLLASPAEWNIFLACDLPLVSGRFLELLVKRTRATRADAVVPRTADGWHPLSAAYHARCRRAFTEALQQGERKLIMLFDQVRVETITARRMARAGLTEGELANMNTPEDWARIAELAKGGR